MKLETEKRQPPHNSPWIKYNLRVIDRILKLRFPRETRWTSKDFKNAFCPLYQFCFLYPWASLRFGISSNRISNLQDYFVDADYVTPSSIGIEGEFDELMNLWKRPNLEEVLSPVLVLPAGRNRFLGYADAAQWRSHLRGVLDDLDTSPAVMEATVWNYDGYAVRVIADLDTFIRALPLAEEEKCDPELSGWRANLAYWR